MEPEKNFALLPKTVTYLDVKFELMSSTTSHEEVLNALKLILPQLTFRSGELMMANAYAFFRDRHLPLDPLRPLVGLLSHHHGIKSSFLHDFLEAPPGDICASWRWRFRLRVVAGWDDSWFLDDLVANHPELFTWRRDDKAEDASDSLSYTYAVARGWCTTWYLNRDMSSTVSADEMERAHLNVKKLVIYGQVSTAGLEKILSFHMPRLTKLKFLQNTSQEGYPEVLERNLQNMPVLERVDFGCLMRRPRIGDKLENRARKGKCNVYEYRVVPSAEREENAFRRRRVSWKD
jgi:hypothetical protein